MNADPNELNRITDEVVKDKDLTSKLEGMSEEEFAAHIQDLKAGFDFLESRRVTVVNPDKGRKLSGKARRKARKEENRASRDMG